MECLLGIQKKKEKKEGKPQWSFDYLVCRGDSEDKSDESTRKRLPMCEFHRRYTPYDMC